MQTQTDLASRLDDLPELLPFPAVAMKLLEASKSDEVGIRDMCRIIECDPGISLSLLRISNTSLYGFGGRVSTIEQAAVLLGTKGLRDLAVSAAAAELFDSAANPYVEKLWQHSLGCATVARILAENIPDVAADEAFLAGLIHDVGKLILITVLQEAYDLVPKALSGHSTVDEESREFGITHAELGGRCGEDWGLPGEVCDAVSFHHEAPTDDAPAQLAEVVGAANQLSKLWNIGVGGEMDIDAADILEENNISIDSDVLEEMCERAPLDFAASKEAFGA